jgi:hypothetical protein
MEPGRLKALATEEGFTRRSCMLSILNYFIAISSANLMMHFRLRILFVVALVVVSLAIANYVAFLRLKPEVSAAAWIANKTGYPSHVVAFHQLAVARVRPEASDAYLPIYDIRNPGFFMLVAELFVRAGATTPLPLEILSIILFDAGALCFFCWVYLLFSDLTVAAFGTAFLALSQFFLFFPGIIHTFPYEFAFFNITLLLFVLFLKTSKNGYLVGALIAMFITCMNYWSYYMSSSIIMIGLWWQYRGRPSVKDVAILSAPPIAAAVLTAIMVMSLFGAKDGVLRIADVLVARTFDARLPGGAWFPDQRFMDAADWHEYLRHVMEKLEWAYGINRWFLIAAGCTFVLLWFRKKSALLSALILLAGGFSWYCVMFQHTHIHWFVGQYSFMAICTINGLIMSETAIVIWAAMRGTLINHRWAIACFEPGTAGGKRPTSLSLVNVAAAALLLAANSLFAWPYLKTTYGMVRQTILVADTVQTEYQKAVLNICRQHANITLADLQFAAKNWDFDWNAALLADANQMPGCSS